MADNLPIGYAGMGLAAVGGLTLVSSLAPSSSALANPLGVFGVTSGMAMVGGLAALGAGVGLMFTERAL